MKYLQFIHPEECPAYSKGAFLWSGGIAYRAKHGDVCVILREEQNYYKCAIDKKYCGGRGYVLVPKKKSAYYRIDYKISNLEKQKILEETDY